MDNITILQNAINNNIGELKKLYTQAKGFKSLIDKVEDDDIKKDLTEKYQEVITTLGDLVNATNTLIDALKGAL